MKKICFVIVLILSVSIVNGQKETFKIGWYQLISGAKTLVMSGNSTDELNKVDATTISYTENEVLLAFNFSKDTYYCFDPDGRIVLVKGKNYLKLVDTVGRPARIIKYVKVGLDLSFTDGNNVWLLGYNSSNSTAQVLLANGTKVDIPQDCIQDLKEFYEIISKMFDSSWHTIE